MKKDELIDEVEKMRQQYIDAIDSGMAQGYSKYYSEGVAYACDFLLSIEGK